MILQGELRLMVPWPLLSSRVCGLQKTTVSLNGGEEPCQSDSKKETSKHSKVKKKNTTTHLLI